MPSQLGPRGLPRPFRVAEAPRSGELVVLALNLAGTFAFGLSGGLAAIRARLDVFGVVVMAAVVALAGGVVRDVLIGVPPATFRDWRYLATALGSGVACLLGRADVERRLLGIRVFDAMGLGLFCVTGASKALAFGLGPAQAVILGSLTAVGGGMLRDVLLREVPAVLRHDLYAIPALLGASVYVVAREAGGSEGVFVVAGATVCFAVRMVGVRFGLGLPVPADRQRPRGGAEPDGSPGHRAPRGS